MEAQTSTSDAVRQALHVVLLGIDPPFSTNEFETLYCAVLEDEVIGERNAPKIIDDFLSSRK